MEWEKAAYAGLDLHLLFTNSTFQNTNIRKNTVKNPAC